MGQGWVGVNTGRVNSMIAAAIKKQQIPRLAGYREMRREPSFNIPSHAKSRFDLLLTLGRETDAYVEIKNTTLFTGEAIMFPDAVTERGRKHLELLGEAVRMGFRGVIVFALNRPEGRYFEPAWEIDPEYSRTLQRVAENGVEILIVRLKHLPHGVTVAGSTTGDLSGATSTQK